MNHLMRTAGVALSLRALAGVALVTAPLFSRPSAELRRVRPAVCAGWESRVAPPAISTPHFLTAVRVTSPAATVARFSLHALPMIAARVDVCRAAQMMIARVGSLYGP